MDPRRVLRRELERIRDEEWPPERADELGLVYRGPADFVLRHGRWWKPTPYPLGVPRGAPKRCFGNAIGLAVLFDLRYVQGYAISPVEPTDVIPHAWNGEEGCAVDATWNPPGIAYLGVALSVERADDGTWWGDADPIDDKHRGWPLLREKWRGEKGLPPGYEPSPSLLALRAYRAGDREGAMRYSLEGWRQVEAER